MNQVVVPSTDGITLAAVLDQPELATATVLVCHPHPEHGGTMTHPLIAAIADHFVSFGVAVVRFNFRGVGASTGVHSGGDGEIEDIQSVATWISDNAPPLTGIAGWSFGAAAALLWQAEQRLSTKYAGIAPPVDSLLSPTLPPPETLVPAERTFIVGDRDQFVDANELEAYGESIGARTVRYETADHFFVFRHDRLAADVYSALVGDK